MIDPSVLIAILASSSSVVAGIVAGLVAYMNTRKQSVDKRTSELLDHLSHEADELRADLERMAGTLSDAREESLLARNAAALDRIRIERLTERVAGLERELIKAARQEEADKAKIEELERENEELKREVQTLRERVATLERNRQ